MTARVTAATAPPPASVQAEPYGADPPLQAEVDDFYIFDGALSEAQLEALMAQARRGRARRGQRPLVPLRRAGRRSRGRLVGAGQRRQDLPRADFPIAYTDVTIDLAERAGSSTLYRVFPQGEARINWLEFRRPTGAGGTGGPP